MSERKHSSIYWPPELLEWLDKHRFSVKAPSRNELIIKIVSKYKEVVEKKAKGKPES